MQHANPRRRTSQVFAPLFVLCALLTGASAARADLKDAAGPNARTERDYVRDRIDYNRRTLTGVYREVGRRDAKWDAAAERFLDAMATYFGRAGVRAVYLPDGLMPREQVVALGKAAADAGCDDPLVTYCRGVLLNDAHQAAEARPLVESSLTGMVQRKYPPTRIGPAADRMTRLLDPKSKSDAARIARYAQLTWEMAIATAAAKVEDRDLRFALAATEKQLQNVAPARYLQLVTAVEASKDANPWLALYHRGKYEVAAAWEARGNGWGNTVTDDGWKRFNEHLGKARDALTKAHALHPDYPEPASAMISVAMGAGDQLNEKARDWFDRAVAAQLDYLPAYHDYLYSIWPRWGGSYDQMLAFGQECAATGRYDTYVPLQLMTAVQQIDADVGSDGTIYDAPPVRQAVRAMLAGMAEKSPSAVDRDGASSDLVGLLWRDGDFRHAAGLMDKLGDRLSPGYFHRVRAWPPGALSQIRAMTSARSTELYAAEEAAARGDADAAAKAYRQAAAALPKDHPGQLYIAHRARALELRKPLLAGEWADLKPTADLAPFSVLNGSATADEKDGSLVVTANQESVATLQLRLDDVGPTYELRAKVDFPDKQRQGNACLFGQCWSDKRYVCGGVGGAHQTVFAINWKVEEQPAQLKGGDTLTLRVNGGTFDVLLGDQVVFKDLPVNPRAPKAACYPGLGINGRDDPGFVVRFHDIQIRRLNANNGG